MYVCIYDYYQSELWEDINNRACFYITCNRQPALSVRWRIFPTQGLNPGLPHCRQILYQLSHKGSPRILEWVAYPFSSGFSWPGNRTGVSCITGWFFTNWTLREALYIYYNMYIYIYYNVCIYIYVYMIITDWIMGSHKHQGLLL